MRLEGKVAVVTGAGRGIGRATALALAEEGAMVAALARTTADVEGVAAEINLRHGAGRAVGIPTDVSQEGQVVAAFAALIERFGRIDVLVNNAAVSSRGSVRDSTLAAFRAPYEVNLLGTFLCSREALPVMLQQGGGRIINVLSGAGKRGFAGLAAYAASKFAIVGFSQSLQLETREAGIGVTCVCPGPTDTGMWDGRARGEDPARVLRPTDIADAIVFVATRDLNVMIPEMEVRPRAYL